MTYSNPIAIRRMTFTYIAAGRAAYPFCFIHFATSFSSLLIHNNVFVLSADGICMGELF